MARKIMEIPIDRKYLLTIEEGAVYFHIGEKRLRQVIAENPYGDFYLKNGNKLLIKRKKFEHYLDQAEAV